MDCKLINLALKLVIVLMLFVLSSSHAAEKIIIKPQQSKVTPTQQSLPELVKVGVHLISIDQLDLYKGTYAMDLHLVFICQKVCPKFNLEIMNGSIQSIQEENSAPDMKIYRLKALMQDNFHSKNYPFDNYWLRLDIKDEQLTSSQMQFVVEPKLIFIDPKVVLHGWEFRHNIQAITSNYIHPILNTVYSKYSFRFNIKRPVLMGLLKVIFPSLIMILFAFLSFMINDEKIINRFGIVSGALLGSVLFHVNLTSSLPPLGYLTFVDAFMLINYLLLFMILFENLYVMRVLEQDKHHKADEIDKVCILLLPLFWVLMQGVNILYFFF